MPANTSGGRGFRPPLRFDWSSISVPTGSPLVMQRLYRTRPNDTYVLWAWKTGMAWRWQVSIHGTHVPLETRSAPTLHVAKHDAELWYLEHGGMPIQTTMQEASTNDDGIPF